jgi:hypothetical protein
MWVTASLNVTESSVQSLATADHAALLLCWMHCLEESGRTQLGCAGKN